MDRTHWQNAIIAVVGLWLIGSTFYADDVTSVAGPVATAPTLNFILVGAAFAGLALLSLLTRQWWEEWALLVLSFWLAISPWVLGYVGAGDYFVATALAAAAIVAVVAGFTVLWSGGSSRY